MLENRAIATSNDGGRLELDLANLGPVAWEAVWDPQGARLEGVEPGPACTVRELDGLSASIACLQDEPATPEEITPLLGPIESILGLLASYESLSEEEQREALSRVETEAEAIAEEIRRQRGEDEPPP